MSKEIIPPRFLPGDTVFAVSGQAGWSYFGMIGFYRISKVEILPHHYKKDIPSQEKRYVYYGSHHAGNLELEYVFANKDEFIEFVKVHNFEFKSPVVNL